MSFNILPFNTYILRTAALPVSFYTNLLEKYSTQKTPKNEIKKALRLMEIYFNEKLEGNGN